MALAAPGEIQRTLRAMVSQNAQRKLITLCAVVLGFGVYQLVAAVYKLGPLGGGIATGLWLLLYFAQIDRRNPRSAVLGGRFAEYLSKGALQSLIPILASMLVFAVCVFFKAANSMAGIAGLIAGAVAWWLSFNQPVPQVIDKLVRGREQPIDLAESKAGEFTLDPNDPGITWGGLRIPSDLATSHFMVVGTTGSGKTLTLRLLMQEVLAHVGSTPDHRAIIYDAKQDLASQITGMGLVARVYTLNPFDERCVAWDIAKDINEPTAALQAAATLIPEEKNSSQPFFVNSAQLLLYGVMLAFIRSGAQWRFSDLIRSMQTVDRLKQVLDGCPETRHIMSRFESNGETLGEVMATVATKLTPYEPIAAMWDQAKRSVSLDDWVKRTGPNFVLILGNNERARVAMDRINQVIFKRLTELLLDQEEDRNKTRRTWVFLDELADAGKLDGLPSLLTKGRSKGVGVVLGFQDIDSLREVYGEHQAAVITGQCNCKAILRLESPKTAEWASKLFGDYEAIEVRKSHTSGFSQKRGGMGLDRTDNESVTMTEHYNKRQSVLESQFYTIPPTTPTAGLTGYYLVPGLGPYRHTYPGTWLFNQGLAPISSNVKDIELRPSDQQWLTVWDEQDALQRKLIAAPAPPPPPSPAAPPPASAATPPVPPSTPPSAGTSAPPGPPASTAPAPAPAAAPKARKTPKAPTAGAAPAAASPPPPPQNATPQATSNLASKLAGFKPKGNP